MDFQKKFIFPRISSSAYRIAEEIVEPTFNMRLIEAVRNARCLYDTTDRQYRNTEYKMKVGNSTLRKGSNIIFTLGKNLLSLVL